MSLVKRNKYLGFIVIVGILLWVGAICEKTREVDAAATSAQHGYTCKTTTISSNSSPVAIMTPGLMTTFIAHAAASPALDPVYMWPYTGSVPSATPAASAYIELSSGAYLTDNIACPAPDCDWAIGQGWAAVLESGSTATSVGVCSR